MEATMVHETTNSAQEGPANPGDPWRDERGRYLPGNPGGPGNPMAREMARMRLLLARRVNDELFDLIVQKLVLLCLKGNLGAIKLLMQYRAGGPDRSVSVDELALDEMRLGLRADALARRCEQASPPEEVPARGRPEAEWRRAERQRRAAEPPAGSRPAGPAMRQAIETIRAGSEAAEAGAECQSGPVQTVADTRPPTVEWPQGAALAGGGG